MFRPRRDHPWRCPECGFINFFGTRCLRCGYNQPKKKGAK